MRWIYKLPLRLRSLFRKSHAEHELDEEMLFHLEKLIEANVTNGMTPDEARYAALREFGGVEQLKEECRDAWHVRFITELVQDVRYGLRQLRRNPGFTVMAVLTLALGIGLNTSIFTLFDAVEFRPLPVENPSTVVNIYQRVENEPGSYRSFSYPEYVAVRDSNKVFSGLVAYSWIPVEVGTAPADHRSGGAALQSREAHGLLVSGNYFTVLGGGVALGRTFVAGEDQTQDAFPEIVLSYTFWKRRLHADPAIIGRSVTLNDIPFTVIGVARRNFVGTEPQTPDFWVPLTMQARLMTGGDSLHDRGSFWLELVARLRPGVTRSQAQSGMEVLINRLSQDYLGTREKARITLAPGSFVARPDVRGQVDSLAFLVMAAVGMVLLIACANIASLLVTRAAGRQKEFGVRLSLGATRRRLIQQLLVESSSLALLGGAGGLLLARWLPVFLIGVLQPPFEQPFTLLLGLDIPVLGYTLLLSLVTGLAFGLSPALQASKPDLLSAIKDEGTSFSGRLGRSRLHSLLVVGEISTCLVLLLAAGLLVQGLKRAQSVDLGFDTKDVVVISLDLGHHGYDETRAAEFHRKLLERLRSGPGVKSVSMASLAPLAGVSRAATITVAGKDSPASTSSHLWDFWVVSSDYFATLGIPILEGRSFSDQDMRGGRPVAIINEAMARQVWPGENPLGKLFRLGPASVPFTEVVGVAKDTRGARLWEENKPYVYLPLHLSTQGPPVQTGQLGMKLLVRTQGNPGIVGARLPRVVRTLDPNVQASYRLLAGSLGRWVWFSQVGAILSSALGLLALLLASLGVYGVMSHSVTQRTHEMGIRMAVGASQNDVLRLVVGQGLRLTLVGVAIGLAAALVVSRLIAGMLYGVRTTDPLTCIAVSFILIAVALLACYIPARRAANVDPMVALRYE